MRLDSKREVVFAMLIGLVVAGTADAAVRVTSLEANDIVYDPYNQKLYASVPSSVGPNGNSIAIIDPFTGTVETSIFVGSEPGKLALSDNSQYLYVALDGAAAIRRVDIAAQLADLQFSLGSGTHGAYYAEDIEVLPGNPEAIAVSLQFLTVSPRFAGVAIYDNGVSRPVVVPGFSGSGNHVNLIEFSSSLERLYGASNSSSPTRFYRMSVDENGVSIIDDTEDIIPGGFGSGNIKFDEGLIYTAQGALIDPEPPTLLGSFIPPSSSSVPLVEPDSGAGRAHFLTTSGSSATISTFNLDFLPIDTLDIAGLVGTPMSFVQWADDGLAFLTSGGQLFLLDSGPPQPECDLTINFTASTLTLGFDLATVEPVRWNLWLSFGSTTTRLWSVPTPPVDPEVSFDVPIPGFPSIGTIGFLTTFVTGEGITCSDWEVVDTGPLTTTFTSEMIQQLLLNSRSRLIGK